MNEHGTVTSPWYRFLTDLHNVCFSETDAVMPNSGLFRSAPMSNSIYRLGQNQQSTTADVTTLQGDVASLTTQVATLEGQVATLATRVTTLQAQVTALQGQIDGAHFGAGVIGSATAGGAGGTPAAVAGYLNLVLGATSFRVPLYLP